MRENPNAFGWVVEAVQLPLPLASGKEREKPQIFYVNNLFHTLVEKPLEMYPRLCWNCLGTVSLAFLLRLEKALQGLALGTGESW